MVTITSFSLDSNRIGLGTLIGQHGQQEIMRQVNAAAGGGSFFGSAEDPFANHFNRFMNDVVKPIYNTGLQIAQTVGNLINPDQYRLINSVAELAKGVPPCMQEGIIYYKPIREGINSGKYDGFGVDPSKLASSDPYEKICESGYYEYDNSTVSDNGEIHVEIEQCSDDPVLTPMEEVDLSMTRKFLFDFINDEDTGILDPTSYPDLHG